jgi:hypothetical protein
LKTYKIYDDIRNPRGTPTHFFKIPTRTNQNLFQDFSASNSLKFLQTKTRFFPSLPVFHPCEYQQMFTADALLVLFYLYYSAFTSTQSTKQFSFSSFTFQTAARKNQKISVVSQVEVLLLVFCPSGGIILVLVEVFQSSFGNKSAKKRSILKLCPIEIEKTVKQKKVEHKEKNEFARLEVTEACKPRIQKLNYVEFVSKSSRNFQLLGEQSIGEEQIA